MRNALCILASTTLLVVLACSRATEPQSEDGRIVMHFSQAPAGAMVASGAMLPAAAAIDTAVVRVFRAGDPVAQETAQVVPLAGGDVEVSIPCIAENGKRVSVDLYEGGAFTHHGFTTGVDVVKGAQTEVTIDAYRFSVGTLSVNPPLANQVPFDLAWGSAPAATSYDVQASHSPDFTTIAWSQAATDTLVDNLTLPPGGYYFRVVPRTPFASGPSCPEQFGYMLGGSNDVEITSLSVPAAKPGDTITIFGQNLDYPGTQVTIGSMNMQVLSWSWGALQVRVPLAASTETINVSSTLGSDSEPFVVQRVAYVTSGGAFTADYVTAMEKHNDDFGFSGIAVVTVGQLDSQDMNVFDVIVVAHDTGTNLNNWGGGVPARANAITDSRANVVAMGRGGAVFLTLVDATTAPYQTNTDSDGDYYAPNGSEQVFTTPHNVGGGFINFTTASNASTTDFAISTSTKPAGVNLYASTDCSRLVVCTGPNDRWVLADFRYDNTGGMSVTYFFWGYADDPGEFSPQATDVLGNVLGMLYRNRVMVPPVDAALGSR